jgi:DNA-binding NtrC family response regulator
LLEESAVIRVDHLPVEIGGSPNQVSHPFVLPASGLDLEMLERDVISQALDRANGNKTGAARLLGLSRDTLRYRLEKYGIQ